MAQNKSKNIGKSTSNEEYVLVYSTDPKPQKLCPNCRRADSECNCMEASIKSINPAYRIEKKGRGGKAVSIIYRLPNQEGFLKKLLKYLKNSIGTGGTSYLKDGEGVIEIQGEQIEKIRSLIDSYKL